MLFDLAAERAELARQRAELEAARAAIEAAKPPPEPAPIDDFEAQVKEFAQAVSPAPTPGTVITLQAVKPASIPAPKTTRPTDMEIVEVLSQHYRVHESKVLEWLLAINLNAVSDLISAEFL